MALSDTLLSQLNERILLLTKRLNELKTQRDGEVDRIQSQILACQQLVQGWDNDPVSQGLDLLPQTGIHLTFDDRR